VNLYAADQWRHCIPHMDAPRLRAAATLHNGSPERLWRRLGCIAFEDIGVADLNTVARRWASTTRKNKDEVVESQKKIAEAIAVQLGQIASG
jgi:replication-associated recombination protein RarA